MCERWSQKGVAVAVPELSVYSARIVVPLSVDIGRGNGAKTCGESRKTIEEEKAR